MSVQAGGPIPRNARLPRVVGGLVVLAVIGVAFTMSGDFVRGRAVAVGRKWPANELVSIEAIDHQVWDRLLQRHVDEAGNVGYSGWKASSADLQALDAYLIAMSRADPAAETSREARLAFWINAYNALTVRGILCEYPTTSVQNHADLGWGFNLWRDLRLYVGNKACSLGEIEHEWLRPLQEPRIHFAIVCGSRGCPRLLNRAYGESDLEQQLGDNARSFFADPQKLEYDESTGQLRLSPILKWYARDFGQSEDELLENIAPYLPDRVPAQLSRKSGRRTSFLDYDWSLNDQALPDSPPPVPPGDLPGASDGQPAEPE